MIDMLMNVMLFMILTLGAVFLGMVGMLLIKEIWKIFKQEFL